MCFIMKVIYMPPMFMTFISGTQKVVWRNKLTVLFFFLGTYRNKKIFSFSVPPIIEPFAFQDGLTEGMRTRTVCGVSNGDPPMLISWLKDDEPLAAHLDVNISTLDSFSSLLSISSLESKHSGNFTCVAKNPAAEVRFSAQLLVKGKLLDSYSRELYNNTSLAHHHHH